jgi:hypothetical protein
VPNQQPIDLGAAMRNLGGMDVTVSPSETLEDAAHRRWKDKTLFIAGLTFLVILFLASFGMLIFGSQSPDDKKIWITVLTSLVSGVIGFTIGKKS